MAQCIDGRLTRLMVCGAVGHANADWKSERQFHWHLRHGVDLCGGNENYGLSHHSPNGSWAILGVKAFSRALMVLPMALLPNARETGLSRSVRRPTLPVWVTSVIIGAVIAIISSGWIILVPMTAAAGVVAWIAYRKIHGQTGDILGATQQITETVGLITLATLY